jgi:hypothetical protein
MFSFFYKQKNLHFFSSMLAFRGCLIIVKSTISLTFPKEINIILRFDLFFLVSQGRNRYLLIEYRKDIYILISIYMTDRFEIN